MEYEEAMIAIVTVDEAAMEIEDHGLDPEDFFAEYGRQATYKGADVLGWLGY